MKRLLKFAVLSLAVATLWGCDDDMTYADPGLEVNPNNIAGTWQLTEWNGSPLAGGSYVYIEFIRKERQFKMYQNLDSFSARCLTGTYNIYTESATGSIIRGIYDHTMGQEWAHRYIVKNLKADSMVWIAKDDPEDISVYVRTPIPDDITDGFDDGKDQ